jgi:PAS domain S-box-containing protein
MQKKFDNDGFKTTARKLHEPILLADSKGKVTWTNQAFIDLCGYTLKEMRGKRPSSFLQGEFTDGDTVLSMREAMQKRVPYDAEILNYHKKGHTYWADISVTPFFDEDGELEGFLGIAHDATLHRLEINQMEKQIVTVYTVLLAEEYKSTGGAARADIFSSDPFLSQLEFSEAPI